MNLMIHLIVHFFTTVKARRFIIAKQKVSLLWKNIQNSLIKTKKSKLLQQSVFVSCFSEKNDSMLMWSHYGDEHKGICLGYDLRTLIQKHDFLPVIYSNRMPQDKSVSNENESALLKYILTKGECWSYEHEWRIIKIEESFSEKTGKPIPFAKPIEIYMGARQREGCDKNLERRTSNSTNASSYADEDYVSIAKVADYARSQNAKLWEFKLNSKKFQLEAREIKV